MSHPLRTPVWMVILAAAVAGCMGGDPASSPGDTASNPRDEPSVGVRIPVPGQPFRVAAGEGLVWVLNRAPRPCSPPRPCTVSRIDPASNQAVGAPTPLPADAWDLAVGAGSAWATQFDGRLIRIDARTGRITARISARPLYFGSVVTFGAGFVWTGNDDERNKRGSVSKIDPATNRVVGNVPGLGSPQSIAYGQGAVWVADHAGWLVKIDPTTLEVVARQRLDFGPHGVVVTADAVYVADAHADRLLEADPRTAKVRRITELPVGPIHPAVGAGSIWSSSAAVWDDMTRDDRVVRIDPRTLRIVQTLRLGGVVPSVAFGFGSVWIPVRTGSVVRTTPLGSGRPSGLILFWKESPWPSLWSVRPDGSRLRRVYRTHQNAKRPALSPDRKWIAFDGASPGKPPLSDFDIQIVRVDGTGRRTLAESREWELDAQWSPDGARLSFSRWSPEGEADDWLHSQVWTVRTDGSDEVRLGRGIGARWSPDGRTLVFGAPTDDSDGDLYVTNADGTGRRRLLATPELEQPAGWSPDGTKILFTRFGLPEGADVFVMDADGGHVRRLTSAGGDDIAAAWSPDGAQILFTVGTPGAAELWVMDADGSSPRSISRDLFRGFEPSWR